MLIPLEVVIRICHISWKASTQFASGDFPGIRTQVAFREKDFSVELLPCVLKTAQPDSSEDRNDTYSWGPTLGRLEHGGMFGHMTRDSATGQQRWHGAAYLHDRTHCSKCPSMMSIAPEVTRSVSIKTSTSGQP